MKSGQVYIHRYNVSKFMNSEKIQLGFLGMGFHPLPQELISQFVITGGNRDFKYVSH